MRTQFFILATAIIISLLILFRPIHNQNNIFYAKKLSHNFENEISYIAENFNLSCIEDFLSKFESFSNSLGYNFSYICWTNSLSIKSITDCNTARIKLNCCYYFKSNKLINISVYDKSLNLIPVKEWICFYYNISGEGEHVEDFFCA